jgi:ABC-type Zn uptake system ZnuABC Zn-binding protein ZnuA
MSINIARVACFVLVLVAGCGGAGVAGDRPVVVATTTELGDIVRQVAGDGADVHQILQPNSDPHDYEPRPHDVKASVDAVVVVRSGAGLDDWAGEILDAVGGDPAVLTLAEHVPHRIPDDPHWWHDPRNVSAAVVAIRDALVRALPGSAAVFRRNAEAYLERLRALDEGIAACMARVPAAQRKLVTSHDAFGHFTQRYGIAVVGAIFPAGSTHAQPSAGEVASLVDVVRREGVRAVFPEASLNPGLAQALARETGARADLELYGDALGPPGSAGDTYLKMEAANADAMVRGFTAGTQNCGVSVHGR